MTEKYANRALTVLAILLSVVGALLMVAQIGCAGSKPAENLGDWFRDWQASVGAEVCADAKVTFGPDGVDVEWSAEACAAAALKGVDVAEFCVDTGSEGPRPWDSVR